MGERRPNIVVLVLDTVRAKNISSYGYDKKTTPNIDRLARKGTIYENAYTVSPWTLPSHASLFTGLYPSEHGAHAGTNHLPEVYPTLAERLADSGYTTMGYSNNVWLTEERGMSRGFENFFLMWQYFDTEDVAAPMVEEIGDLKKYLEVLKRIGKGNPLKRLFNLIYGYIYGRRKNRADITRREIMEGAREATEPFFIFANFMEAHHPYRPPRKHAELFLPSDVSYQEALKIPQKPWQYVFGDRHYTEEDFVCLESLYNGAVHYLDSVIGRIVEDIEDSTERDTIFYILSDHGENLGDHGMMAHQYSLENTVLRIPLVVYGRGKEEIDTPVDMIDVHRFIASDANIETKVSGAKDPEKGEKKIFAEYKHPTPPLKRLRERFGTKEEDLKGRQSMDAVISGNRKLVRFANREELRENSYEETDIKDPQKVEELSRFLSSWENSMEKAATADAKLEEAIKGRLEKLGYY